MKRTESDVCYFEVNAVFNCVPIVSAHFRCILHPRNAMLTPELAMVLCLCVCPCLCLCLSQLISRCSIERDKLIDLFSGMKVFFDLSYSVL